MANPKRLLALVLSAGAIGVGSYYLLSGDDDDTAGTKRLVNQVWIERLPENAVGKVDRKALARQAAAAAGQNACA